MHGIREPAAHAKHGAEEIGTGPQVGDLAQKLQRVAFFLERIGGIGFAKHGAQNLELLRHLDALAELGRPLLVGASRKSFIGELTGAPPAGRHAGSLAAAGWAALHGAAILRVHDVAATVQFLAVQRAIDQPSPVAIQP